MGVNLKTFRIVALLEATSFLVLLICTAVKYAADQPAGVQIMGPVHGALFLAYVFLALVVRLQTKWTFWQTIAILVAAVLPTGGYFVDAWLTKNERRLSVSR